MKKASNGEIPNSTNLEYYTLIKTKICCGTESVYILYIWTSPYFRIQMKTNYFRVTNNLIIIPKYIIALYNYSF